ncbi:MAG: hypothetical protein GX620_00520 [Chloroflexi bacterium]|nr:hypothetical protein [Chloroflexota bacterium]
MSIEFEWRLQDELLPESSEPAAPTPGRWRRMARAAVALGLILALLGVGWHISRERNAQTELQVEALARLELEAITARDHELFLSLQDPATPTWLATQDALFWEGQILPPPLPGLAAVTDATVGSGRVVGDRARVELLRTAGPPSSPSGAFRVARFYRRDAGGRWLHTQLDPAYAGHVMVWVGDHVEITGYAADAVTIAPAAADLERVAAGLCVHVACRTALPVHLVFTGTLDVDVTGSVLPAPLLVGVPVDQRAQEIWQAALRDIFLEKLLDPASPSQIGQ